MTSPLDLDQVYFLGDNGLILSQQLGAWCGRSPDLEEDIALANTALDLLGQAKLWLGYAAERRGGGSTANDLAFKRTSKDFRHALLVEQPNGDYGHTLVRQFLFDAWHHPYLDLLQASRDQRAAAIAAKAVKEAAYHLERSQSLVERLGAGTDESHGYMQRALNALWPFLAELTEETERDGEAAASGAVPDPSQVRARVEVVLEAALKRGGLTVPTVTATITQRGRRGQHGQAFEALLREMQFLPRSYPEATW
ncbi:MAG: 1,2-phenylacetyl-CoA epoxidase subunit PaaC [Myxococcota bacterium]